MARPLGVGVVHSGADVPLGLQAVARAADTPSVQLPLNSVEPVYGVYGVNPYVLMAKFNDFPDRGHHALQHQRRRATFQPEHTGLPIRLPDQHLHPRLRRLSWDDSSGRAGSTA